MGRVINSTFVSLDGVINHLDKWHFDSSTTRPTTLPWNNFRPASRC
jgi:hypothetical protein